MVKNFKEYTKIMQNIHKVEEGKTISETERTEALEMIEEMEQNQGVIMFDFGRNGGDRITELA